MNDDRAPKGFFLAPLITSILFGLLVACLGLVSDLSKGEINPYVYLKAFLIFLVSALPVAYAVTIIIGIPSYYIFYTKSKNSFRFYFLGGLLLGLISPALLFPFFGIQEIVSLGWLLFVTSSFFGSLTSCLFWFISIKIPNKKLQSDP